MSMCNYFHLNCQDLLIFCQKLLVHFVEKPAIFLFFKAYYHLPSLPNLKGSQRISTVDFLHQTPRPNLQGPIETFYCRLSTLNRPAQPLGAHRDFILQTFNTRQVRITLRDFLLQTFYTRQASLTFRGQKRLSTEQQYARGSLKYIFYDIRLKL